MTQCCSTPHWTPTEALIGRLQDVGVDTGTFTTAQLGARPGRSAVVTASPSVLTAAREAGFALVIGDRSADTLRPLGADTVVADLDAIAVRSGTDGCRSFPMHCRPWATA